MPEPPPAPFEIDVSSPVAGVRVVALRGELDLDQAPSLARVLDELRASGSRELVVDLSRLDFVDSSGISTLLGAARAVAADRGMLVVAAPTAHVRRVFEIVNLSEVVAIEDDVERALQRIGWSREQTAG